jgi:HK97 family phage prohead protease
MAPVKRLTQRKAASVFGFKAVAGEAEGTFEAFVSVFNNVDLGNEKVMPGFFAKSLEQWKASGDPIPVIFSHQWDNLDAHVGVVLDAKEALPGDPLLPPELSALGGLWVKARLDVEEDFAGRLWRKMDRRSIREFSFAYDVTKARPGSGGALELLEGDLIEVGPTLKGMNPATALLSAKAAEGPLEMLEEADTLAGVPHPEPKALPMAALEGSLEAQLTSIRESASVWAALEYGRDLYALHLEATFPSESRAIVTVERWEDPWGEGPVWELNYSTDAEGLITVESATPIEVTVELRAKMTDHRAESRKALEYHYGKRFASSAEPVMDGTLPAQSDGKAAEDPLEGKAAEDPKTMTTQMTPSKALVDIELIALT